MKKHLFVKVILILIGIIILMSGCEFIKGKDKEVGSLILKFSTEEMRAKTILPSLDMDIAYYNIYGDGPGTAAFSQAGVTETTVIENSLVVGAWVVTVEVYNADDYLIGDGSASVGVEAGQTSQVEVPVTPLTGSGGLSISISWPEGMIIDPSVSATLTPAGGTEQTLSFTAGVDSASYASGNTLDAGYYSLRLQILDGGIAKWGLFEAVRILSEQTTAASFVLTAEDITNMGSVEITITPDMQDPIEISFTGQQLVLTPGTDMTVTATTSADPVDTYQWYLGGGLLSGETDSSITIGSSLGEGKYRLDLGVTKGNIVSSESVEFSVSLSTGTDGLVAFYSFAGNTNDLSGNDRHGVSANVSYRNDRNERGNASAFFDGDAFVRVQGLGQTESFSIAVWYKTTESGCIVSTDNIQLYTNKPDNRFGTVWNNQMGTGLGTYTPGGNPAYFNDTWHHVVVTHDAEDGRIITYFDNEVGHNRPNSGKFVGNSVGPTVGIAQFKMITSPPWLFWATMTTSQPVGISVPPASCTVSSMDRVGYTT